MSANALAASPKRTKGTANKNRKICMRESPVIVLSQLDSEEPLLANFGSLAAIPQPASYRPFATPVGQASPCNHAMA